MERWIPARFGQFGLEELREKNETSRQKPPDEKHCLSDTIFPILILPSKNTQLYLWAVQTATLVELSRSYVSEVTETTSAPC